MNEKLKRLFEVWKRKNGEDFYLFSFTWINQQRWQIAKKNRTVSLAEIFCAPEIVDGVDLNRSYNKAQIIFTLQQALGL